MALDRTSPFRRPLGSRRWSWIRGLAAALARQGISPNAISVSGLVAAALCGACLVATGASAGTPRWPWLVAAMAIQVRLLANLLDGLVAVEGGRRTPTGELFNEVPDRVADTCVLVALGHALGGDPTLGFVAAGLAIFTAYVRVQVALAGAPMDFRGPCAKPQRMALVTATCLWMGLAPAPWRFTVPGAATLCLSVLIAGGVWTAAARLRRASRWLWTSESPDPGS